MGLKELLKKMQDCLEAMKGIRGKAQAATDEVAKTALTAELTGKTAEFNALKEQVETARAEHGMDEFITALESDVETDEQGKSLNPKTKKKEGSVETIHDKEREEHQRRDAFLEYCERGKSQMTPEKTDLIKPSERILGVRDLAGDVARVPVSLVNAIIGKSLYLDPRLRGKVMLVSDATGAETDSGGANLIAPDFRPQLLRPPVDLPMLFDFCTPIPAVNGSASFPRLEDGAGGGIFGGVAFTWKSTDGADKGETEPTFGSFTITTNELSGWTELSLTMLRRSALDLEALITALFRESARYEWSRTILNGTGTNQPTGLNSAAAAITEVNRAAIDVVSYDDLVNLEYALTKGHRAGARHIVEDSVERSIVIAKDTQGRPLFTADTASGPRDRLVGYPYLTHEFTPSLGEDGDAVFGNLANYFFAIEEDIAIARSEHAAFKQGRVVFRMICFVGGKPVRSSAFSKLVAPAA